MEKEKRGRYSPVFETVPLCRERNDVDDRSVLVRSLKLSKVTDDETTGERTLAGDSALVGGETTLTNVEALLRWLLVDLQNALVDLPIRSAMFMMFTTCRSSDRHWLEPLMSSVKHSSR